LPNAPVELGETFTYAFQAKDSAGNPVTPGTVTIAITRPDGTAGTVSQSGLSPAVATHLTTQVGRHVITGSATGGALGTDVRAFEDSFSVEPAGRYIVGLDEALSHLAAVGVLSKTDDLEQLRWYILAAGDAVERDLGRTVARQTFVERVSGGDCHVRLRRTPVLSVTQVVENTTTLTNASGTDYALDELETTGLLYRGSTTAPGVWSWGRGNITVTYVAGYTAVPAIVRKVVLNVVERMWQGSQNAGHPGLVDDMSTDAAVFGVVGSSLTEPEQRAYASLRAWPA